jgi:hypothetical protein
MPEKSLSSENSKLRQFSFQECQWPKGFEQLRNGYFELECLFEALRATIAQVVTHRDSLKCFAGFETHQFRVRSVRALRTSRMLRIDMLIRAPEMDFQSLKVFEGPA